MESRETKRYVACYRSSSAPAPVVEDHFETWLMNCASVQDEYLEYLGSSALQPSAAHETQEAPTSDAEACCNPTISKFCVDSQPCLLKALEEDDLIDTMADLVLDAMDGDEETVRHNRNLRKLSQAEEPTPQNPAASTEVEKNLIKALKLGMTFTFTCLSEGKTPDGFSSMVLDGIFHVIGIESQNAAIAHRLDYLSAENKIDFRLHDMDESYVKLKTIHTRLHKKMKSNTKAREGKRLLAIESIQAHLWSKVESTDNYEYYGVQSYLLEARWFAKRMAKIQYLGTSLLEMMAELWTQGEESPYDEAGIAKYRQELQDTFTKRIAKYEQTLLTVHGHGRVEKWPSTMFVLQQGDLKAAGAFPQLCRLQIGDDDLFYESDAIKQQHNAYRDGDLRSAWALHPNDNDTFGLATSEYRFKIRRRDARKLPGEAITTSYVPSGYSAARNEKVGRFKLIPQPGGDASTFSLRLIDFANSRNEVTDIRVAPTAATFARQSFGSALTDSDVREFEVNIFNASSSRKRVVVLNEVHGQGGFYFKEATAASHCIVTNRDDQKHMRIFCRQASETPRMSIKLKVYWIEDGNISDERLTKAFRRSPIQGRTCLSGSGIKETADIFIDIDLVDGVFWWENSVIRCDVTQPQEPAVDDIDRYNYEGWEVKANVSGTQTFDTANLIVGMNVAKGSRAVASVMVCGMDDFLAPHD
ncbi:hypothetical protein QFC20_004270 [Naganishia adeliensis]|uniref:Uncharacterized protein n=1 Tax=Naganishia adeliensis TaxID=92952 RepID=A0ACC2W309_9TREE|nr:hypothetical protein QFC20_004270 [Naganishia adeliensis]